MASPILLALALAVLAFGPEGALAFITCQVQTASERLIASASVDDVPDRDRQTDRQIRLWLRNGGKEGGLGAALDCLCFATMLSPSPLVLAFARENRPSRCCYCDSTYMGTLSNSYSTCSAYNCAANYRYSGYSCYYVYARTYDPYIIAAICLGVAILVGVLVCVFRRRQSKTTVVTYTAPAYTGPPQYSSPNPQRFFFRARGVFSCPQPRARVWGFTKFGVSVCESEVLGVPVCTGAGEVKIVRSPPLKFAICFWLDCLWVRGIVEFETS
ncbi:hypothetical protein DFJ73DRAFT_959083 [Zopfochytrium polystomum]|nr:hypothetical protein DFJ73DRAFT_959083 [Zopfochytrium polystomum]